MYREPGGQVKKPFYLSSLALKIGRTKFRIDEK